MFNGGDAHDADSPAVAEPMADDWQEWRQHILRELKRLASAVDSLTTEVGTLRERYASLTAKVGLWGGLFGLVVGGIVGAVVRAAFGSP